MCRAKLKLHSLAMLVKPFMASTIMAMMEQVLILVAVTTITMALGKILLIQIG